MKCKPFLRFTCLWWFVLVLLAACSPSRISEVFPDRQPAGLFRPPTAVNGPTAARGAARSTPGAPGQPEQTAAASPLPCKDNLIFIKDLTIPDGTVVEPLSTLDKRWEIENNGNCGWGEKYRVRLIAGPELGAQKEQALYPARGGSQAVIRIVFHAPAEPGTYRSAWQAFDAQGAPFGDPFFIEIVVASP